MDDAVLTLASCAACFWLGFQIGHIRSELRHKGDVGELERRYKIVDCKVIGSSSGKNADVRL